MPDDRPPDLNDATAQRRREDALLAELTEPDLDEVPFTGANGTDGGG